MSFGIELGYGAVQPIILGYFSNGRSAAQYRCLDIDLTARAKFVNSFIDRSAVELRYQRVIESVIFIQSRHLLTVRLTVFSDFMASLPPSLSKQI